MPHVIAVAPNFPANQRRFVRGLKSVGAHVTGLGDTPPERLDPEIRELLDGYEHVGVLGNVDQMTDAVRRIQRRGPWVDRLEATVEAHVLATAQVREATGIPGLSSTTVNLCRDKFVMKQQLRARGIPCARNAEVGCGDDAWRFVREQGYPVILKPRDGAGAAATYKIDNDDQLRAALSETGLDRSERWFTMEEFVAGHEGFYDTLTCQGEVRFEAITHYYPNVLDGMRDRSAAPQMVATNRIDASGYGELKSFGRRVVRELGLTTTATHMEWFAGPKGLFFSEIGARPPGCNWWDTYCAANDFDLYTEWARAVVWGEVREAPSRQYAAGLVNLRPDRDGTIAGYSGVDDVQRKYGGLIFKMHLPPVGHRTQPVEAGFLANAYVAVRHPDYDVVRAVLDDIGRTLRVWAR
jgi:hypothetical protein